MAEIRRLLSRARPYDGRLAAGLTCALVTAAFDAVALEVFNKIQDHLQRAEIYAARETLDDKLLALCLLLPGLALLKGVFSYLAKYLIAHATQSVLRDLRADIYRTLVERPVKALQRVPIGELVSRVTNDVQRLEVGLSVRLLELLIAVPAALFVLGYLLVQSWKLTLVTLVLLPPAGWLLRRWSRKLKRASRRAQEHTGSLAAALSESLAGIRVVKAYGAEQQEVDRFGRFNNSLRRTVLSAQRTLAAAPPAMEALAGLTFAILIGFAGWQVGRGELESAVALSFVLGIGLIGQQVKKATNASNELQNTRAAALRCFALIDERQASSEPAAGARSVDGLREGITFEDVTFAHETHPVVQAFDLSVARGEIVALVGESGAGKSTVTDLLVRFLDPDRGRILWDGIDLRELDPRSLRAQIALVTQDTIVFNDTVVHNIAYGDPRPDPARARAAAQAAQALDFVERLPEGFDTILGERGGRLSGGERQRIAIARAIYKDAPVLILDEATSSLDAQSESLVQQALDHLMSDRTVFIVAHRLATVRHADRIVVMGAGRIVQVGSHDELLERGGAYRHLHHLQTGKA
jgi:subfamily B ATP-binding cassette protein MsbA